jgi:hypothetical protein
VKPESAVRLIESAYRTEGTTQQWLQAVAESAAGAFTSASAMAFRYEASAQWINSDIPVLHGLTPEFAFDFFNHKDAPPEAAQAMARIFLSVRFGSLREVIENAPFPGLGAALDRHHVEDMAGVNGLDPSGRGCMLTIVTPRRSHSPRTAHLWHRLAAHISAGNRLRSVLEKLAAENSDPTSRAEAVLSPNGKIENATGPAEPRAEVKRSATPSCASTPPAPNATIPSAPSSSGAASSLVAGRSSNISKATAAATTSLTRMIRSSRKTARSPHENAKCSATRSSVTRTSSSRTSSDSRTRRFLRS